MTGMLVVQGRTPFHVLAVQQQRRPLPLHAAGGSRHPPPAWRSRSSPRRPRPRRAGRTPSSASRPTWPAPAAVEVNASVQVVPAEGRARPLARSASEGNPVRRAVSLRLAPASLSLAAAGSFVGRRRGCSRQGRSRRFGAAAANDRRPVCGRRRGVLPGVSSALFLTAAYSREPDRADTRPKMWQRSIAWNRKPRTLVRGTGSAAAVT